MVGDAVHDNRTNGPEHLQHLGCRSSQLDGRDFTAVCWCVGNEDTPWDSLEKLRHEHDRERIGKVEDQDEAVQEHEAGDSRPAVSNTAGKGTSEADTDNC